MSEVVTTQEILEKMRRGYEMSHVLKYGDFEFKVRLLKNDEELTATESARLRAKEAEMSEDKTNLEIMKAMLFAAGSTGGMNYITSDLLGNLTVSEVEALYRRYIDIVNEVDTEFQEIDYELINSICDDVRKKKLNPKKVSTSLAAMIGRFFLADVLPKVNELGS